MDLIKLTFLNRLKRFYANISIKKPEVRTNRKKVLVHFINATVNGFGIGNIFWDSQVL